MNNTIDIYKIINGQYKTDTIYFCKQIDIENVNKLDELLEFCEQNNVLISDSHDDILLCKDTKQPKYYIR